MQKLLVAVQSLIGQKTHKGAAKRFSLTKNGKVKRAQAFKRHILTKKPTKRTRNLRKAAYLGTPVRSLPTNTAHATPPRMVP